ncbi:MAG: glycosyl hydrolase family 79 C-terminal domain-containing protein [Solirubrobacteraceae bacterium]
MLRHRGRLVSLAVAVAVAVAALAIGPLPAAQASAHPRGNATASARPRVKATASARPRARTSQADVYATVSGTPSGAPIAPGFVGVSLEYRALHNYTGRNPNAINPVLVALLRALAPGQAPVLRIGGNSTDSTWWPIPGVIPPHEVTYGLTNGWLRTTRALASALGAHLILGVNLAAGRAAFAAAEARAFLQGIGRRYVKALEIGNEADVYNLIPGYFDSAQHPVYARPRSYDLASFTREFSRWHAALPAVPVAGPAFAGFSWLSGLPRFLSAERGLGLVTFHRYPLRGCVSDPTSPQFASIPNLLSDRSSAGLAQSVAPYVTVARAHGLPFRIDEMNSAACEGRSGVSDTFASALWVLDTLFNMANVGVQGVNLHTLPGARYEPFSFTHSGGAWHAFVHPEYYGMLMFAQAAPPGSQLLPVSVASGPVKIWATRGLDGRVRVVLINQDPGSSHEVQLETGASTVASLQWLLAPSVSATSGVSLAGRTFGAQTDTGTLAGTLNVSYVDPASGAYTVALPPGSAVLLTQ